MARGFASLSPERRKAISAMGNAVSAVRNKFNSETGSLAGKIGGKAKHPNKGKRKKKNGTDEKA